MLNIPLDGEYIGLLGSLDKRNNIPQLLEAFSAAKLPQQSRLLLAGRASKAFELLIYNNYSKLIGDGRIIFINRFLSDREIIDGYQALDICCIPRTGFPGLSSLALKSLAAHRPLLVHDFGWSSYITSKFNLGQICDMEDTGDFANAIANVIHFH